MGGRKDKNIVKITGFNHKVPNIEEKGRGHEFMAEDKWEFYKDTAGEWRWRRTAPNGNIVGASAGGYKNKSDCIDNARRNGYNG